MGQPCFSCAAEAAPTPPTSPAAAAAANSLVRRAGGLQWKPPTHPVTGSSSQAAASCSDTPRKQRELPVELTVELLLLLLMRDTPLETSPSVFLTLSNVSGSSADVPHTPSSSWSRSDFHTGTKEFQSASIQSG